MWKMRTGAAVWTMPVTALVRTAVSVPNWVDREPMMKAPMRVHAVGVVPKLTGIDSTGHRRLWCPSPSSVLTEGQGRQWR